MAILLSVPPHLVTAETAADGEENGEKHEHHSSLKGRKIENKFTGAGIGAKFSTIMYRITTKNLKIGQRGVFEKMRFLYFHLMAQMQIFGPKMQFFGPKSIFFQNCPKILIFSEESFKPVNMQNVFLQHLEKKIPMMIRLDS